MDQSENEDDGSFLECPICLTPVEDIEHIVILRSEQNNGYCDHSYCRDCVQEILDKAQNPCCPHCQRKIIGYETNRMAMELKELVRKMKQELKQVQKANAAQPGAQAKASDELLQKQRVEHERAIQKLNDEIEEQRKTSAELRSLLETANANAERLQTQLRGREADLQRELREQSMRNEILRQKASELEKQINSLQAADGARAEQLGKLLAEQRSEIERGRRAQQQLEQQLESTKAEADKNRRLEESRRREIEQRYNKTVDKFHSMRESLKQKEIQAITMATTGSSSTSPASPFARKSPQLSSSSSSSHHSTSSDTSSSTLVGSSLLPLATTLSSLWQSPMKFIRSITSGSPSSSDAKSTNLAPSSPSSLGKFVSYYLQKEFTGPLVLSMRNFSIFERRGSKLTSRVWRGSLASDGKQGKIFCALKKFYLPTFLPAPPTETPSVTKDPASISVSVGSESDYDRNYNYLSQYREALMLHSLDHPHILKLNGIIRDAPNFYAVSPFYDHDLEYISEENPLTLPQIQTIAFQLLQAVSYLHNQDIVHRNIRPSSVMLSFSGSANVEPVARRYSVRLGAFSLARSLHPPYPKHLSDLRNLIEESSLSLLDPSQPWFEDLTSPCSNMRYWAPEIILKECLHMVFPSFDWKKADLWSVGVTIAEMLRQGRRMFLKSDARGLLDEMVSFTGCWPTDPLILERFPFLNVPVDPASTGRDLEDWILAPRGTNERKLAPVGALGPLNHNQIRDRAIDLVRRLLQADPRKRMTAEEALAHPFFEEARSHIISSSNLKEVKKAVTDDNLLSFVQSQCGGI